MQESSPPLIYVFTIRLLEIEPTIWRRIEVPEYFSFWDLHAAIQDAMGWLDCHLHEYRLNDVRGGQLVRIGIPDEEDYEIPPLRADWKVPITRFFKRPGQRARYLYDFGDGWKHDLQLTAIAIAESELAYPRCAAGERACPPEDCGGPRGYRRLLKVLSDQTHPDRREKIGWLRNHARNCYPYRPEKFDPSTVVFADPAERLRMMWQ